MNAGASDTAALYQVVSDLISKAQEAQIDHGHQEGSRSRKQYCAAWIEGDSVLSTVKARLGEGEDFDSLGDGPCKTLREWDFEPIFAHAYLGGRGIARALAEGADVVVCGRVSDASLVTGAALWWHGWSTTEHLDRLANAFIAGHLIECSSYVCGGNFTGFKALGERGQWTDIGFPIAEIGHGGEVIITKEKGSGGIVSVDTCTAQLVYEIQGPLYYNSDVTAVLDDIAFEPLGQNRVAVKGVRGLPPPRTTKVGLTARGGYQAEVHFYVVGLDAMEKVAMLEDQIRHVLKPYSDKFSLLEVTAAGVPAENPTTQISATVDVRVLVQARNQEDLSSAKFVGPVTDCQMQAYPGATLHLDLRMARPKPIFEYFVTLLPQNAIEHKVHLADGRSIPIDAPKDDGKETVVYPKGQKSTDSQTSQLQSSRFRKTIHGPLGWIVHARSGDKGANANVGLWVRNSDEYDWLKGLLSIQKIKELLAGEFTGGEIVSDCSLLFTKRSSTSAELVLIWMFFLFCYIGSIRTA